MNKIFFITLFVSCIFPFRQEKRDKALPTTEPVFQVDYAYPTEDKPQSKLWFTEGCWWALLPRTSGPSLWQRTDKGWKEHVEVCSALTNVSGRADVWADDDQVTAVGVGKHSLSVFRLNKKKDRHDSAKIGWDSQLLNTLESPEKTNGIETATIVRDSKNNWWIAAPINKAVYVWSSSSDGKRWSSPIKLKDGIDEDDICMITVLPEGKIGVIWSDQIQEKFVIREHIDGDPIDKWENGEIIDEGGGCADDHLNSALSPDGTLWLVTKNSIDEVNRPQLTLYVRSPNGQWGKYPYATLEKMWMPTRPIVVATEDPSIVLAGHTLYNSEKSILAEIAFGQIDTTQIHLFKKISPIISPAQTVTHEINDVTGSKKTLPTNSPWIVLASDRDGKIYEADLRELLVDIK